MGVCAWLCGVFVLIIAYTLTRQMFDNDPGIQYPTSITKCVNVNHDQLRGTEDFAAFDVHTAFVSAGDLFNVFPSGASKASPGAIFLLNAKENRMEKVKITGLNEKLGFQPHGIYFSSTTRRLYAVSHADELSGTKVEVFQVEGANDAPSLRHVRSVAGDLGFNNGLSGVIEGAEDGSDVYVTQLFPFGNPVGGWRNPNQTLTERAHSMYNMLNMALGFPKHTSVYRCTVPSNAQEASVCKVVADGLSTANGIAITPSRTTVFVSDTVSQLVKVYDRDSMGNLKEVNEIRTMHPLVKIAYHPSSGSLIGGTVPEAHKTLPLIHRPIKDFFFVKQAYTPLENLRLVPGGMLRITPSSGGSFMNVTQEVIMKHDGSLLMPVSSGVLVGGKAVLMSPLSNSGVFVCEPR